MAKDNAAYRVDIFVTNPADDTTQRLSGELVLSSVVVPVAVAPRMVTQPVGAVITAGQHATLTVQAIGTPPLAYAWYSGPETPVPGATAATVTVGPAATTSYFCRVSNASGIVDSGGATVTVQPNIVPIEGLGLTYRRKIGLPSIDMQFAYGDMTGRIVNGKVHLLMGGSVTIGSPIYEVELDDNEPVARFVQWWSDPYNGKRGTWVTATSARATADALRRLATRDHNLRSRARFWSRVAATAPRTGWVWVDLGDNVAVNGSHYWHPSLDGLLVSYADTYNVAGRPDWNTVFIRLHADGTAETFGPFRFECTDGDGTRRQGPFAASYLREDPTTGLVMTGIPLGSGNSAFPWGPNCITGAPWPTPERPAGPETPNLMLSTRWLFHYFMGTGAIDPVTGIAVGPIRSARRKRDPYQYEYLPENTMSVMVDPAKYGGVGSWTDNDGFSGILPLADRAYFFASVLGSPIQDPFDCRAAHGWYATASNDWTCSHGCAAVPYGITGPIATAKFPYVSVYPWASLEATKNTPLDYTPEPAYESNLETDFGIVTAPVDSIGNAKMNAAGFFNPATRRYYTIAQGADRGEVTFGLVNAYIHEWDVA